VTEEHRLNRAGLRVTLYDAHMRHCFLRLTNRFFENKTDADKEVPLRLFLFIYTHDKTPEDSCTLIATQQVVYSVNFDDIGGTLYEFPP
jgi:hypothetical protein